MHGRSISSAPGEVVHGGKKKPERLLVLAMAKNPEPKSVAILERTPLDDLASWPPLPTLVHQCNTAPSHLRPSCPITMIGIPRPSNLSVSSAANSSDSKAAQSLGRKSLRWWLSTSVTVSSLYRTYFKSWAATSISCKDRRTWVSVGLLAMDARKVSSVFGRERLLVGRRRRLRNCG